MYDSDPSALDKVPADNTATRYQPTGADLLIVVASLLLLTGLLAPSLRLEPRDEASRMLQVMRGLPLNESYSVLRGIFALIKESFVIGLMLLVFTVVFPVAKLMTFFLWSAEVRRGCQQSKAPALSLEHSEVASNWRSLVERFGKWSMLDVYVVGIVVVAYKPVIGVTVALEWGFYFFAASVALTLFIPAAVRAAEKACMLTSTIVKDES